MNIIFLWLTSFASEKKTLVNMNSVTQIVPMDELMNGSTLWLSDGRKLAVKESPNTIVENINAVNNQFYENLLP